jgi:hypothetical protein
VENLIQDYGYDSKISEARVFLVWKDIVGGFVANNTEPSSLIEGKFRIWVKNNVLLSELHLLSRNLIEKINSKIGRNVVKELRFQLKQFSCSRQGNQPQGIAETDCKIGEIEIGQEVSPIKLCLSATGRRRAVTGGDSGQAGLYEHQGGGRFWGSRQR